MNVHSSQGREPLLCREYYFFSTENSRYFKLCSKIKGYSKKRKMHIITPPPYRPAKINFKSGTFCSFSFTLMSRWTKPVHVWNLLQSPFLETYFPWPLYRMYMKFLQKLCCLGWVKTDKRSTVKKTMLNSSKAFMSTKKMSTVFSPGFCLRESQGRFCWETGAL